MTFLLQMRNSVLVSQIVWQHETIHTRRHAILRCFIAELDDFLDHLGFAVVERAFLFANLKQCAQFLVAQAWAAAQMCWRESVEHIIAHDLESAADMIEKRHRDLQRERAYARQSRGRRERHKFRY